MPKVQVDKDKQEVLVEIRKQDTEEILFLTLPKGAKGVVLEFIPKGKQKEDVIKIDLPREGEKPRWEHGGLTYLFSIESDGELKLKLKQ